MASISISMRVPQVFVPQSISSREWISALFLEVSIDSTASTAFRRLTFERITTGLPVVSFPYMPAAEMPMPCCPRLWESLWNFDPYSSWPKILPICVSPMPGPLSSTAMR